MVSPLLLIQTVAHWRAQSQSSSHNTADATPSPAEAGRAAARPVLSSTPSSQGESSSRTRAAPPPHQPDRVKTLAATEREIGDRYADDDHEAELDDLEEELEEEEDLDLDGSRPRLTISSSKNVAKSFSRIDSVASSWTWRSSRDAAPNPVRRFLIAVKNFVFQIDPNADEAQFVPNYRWLDGKASFDRMKLTSFNIGTCRFYRASCLHSRYY